jgi:phage terminase small subunit
MKKTRAAPAHLQPDTAAWFDSVLADFVLEPHQVRILTLAGEAWDRCVEARQRIAKEGLTVEGREGLKTHPCVAIERDARAAFARLVAQLGLDDADEPQRGPGRPGQGFGVTYEQLDELLPHRTRRKT